MEVDVKTSYLVIGLLYLIMPLAVWVVLAGQRSHVVKLWCGGGMLIGMGALLIGLRAHVPEWATFLLANVLIFVSGLLRSQAIRLELGRPWQARWMWAAAVLFVLIFQGIHEGLGNDTLRLQFVTLTTTLLFLHISLMARRLGRLLNSPSAYWIAATYMFAVLALVLRLVDFSLGSATPDVMTPHFTSVLVTFSGILTAIIANMGYIGIVLARTMQMKLESAVTQAQQEEHRRLSVQIAQLDRQRSLGQMSASLGHELNQPLTAILTNAQVAQRGLQAGRLDVTEIPDFLDKIIRNTQRASEIIEKIRTFIRPTDIQRVPVNLEIVVQDVLDLVIPEANKGRVEIHFIPHKSATWVQGDAIQLSQVLLNLVRNAMEAMQQTTRREIYIDMAQRAHRVLLRVSDTGPGLTPEALEEAGKPFFTTKASGLGMGLSISRNIITQHGGTLTIGNAPGRGGCVDIDLPALPGGRESQS